MAPDLVGLCYRKNLTVAHALSGQRWLLGLHRISTEPELQQFTKLWTRLGLLVLTPDQDDEISWNHTNNTVYSAKSAYRSQFIGSYSDANYDKLWKAKVEGKCNFFLLDLS